MIKLLWNTHKLTINQKNKKDSNDAVNYKWGVYHKKFSDKWIFEILGNVKFSIIENEQQIESKDTLIIIDSSIDKKKNFYNNLNLICSKIFLIHLGDESGIHDLSEVYNNCNFVWRTFCTNRFFNRKNISCLPIGYKSGVLCKSIVKERKYKWSFLGTPHKSSRHDLLFQLSGIEPSYCYKTKQFNEKIIETDKMNDILSSTIFSPCPNGFVHPETYRLYEALECECIPVVQNTYKYYDRLFPNNPFIKIDKWVEAKRIIETWKRNQIKEKQEEVVQDYAKMQTNLEEVLSDLNKIATAKEEELAKDKAEEKAEDKAEDKAEEDK